MAETAFRARLKHSFELPGRGTILCVDIVEGTVKVGDRLVIPTAQGSICTAVVLGVDFVDFAIGTPGFRSEVALTVRDIRTTDVAVGQEVYSASA